MRVRTNGKRVVRFYFLVSISYPLLSLSITSRYRPYIVHLSHKWCWYAIQIAFKCYEKWHFKWNEEHLIHWFLRTSIFNVKAIIVCFRIVFNGISDIYARCLAQFVLSENHISNKTWLKCSCMCHFACVCVCCAGFISWSYAILSALDS